ncbi:MAG: GerW family sporulation protein [Oscillospiraceae bacterium]|nr:GerW family sporulation protein [Oscillospiraceae bacterium]
MSQNLPNMLENTIAKIREMVDVNSVVGTPITTPDGVTIIPVSKVSVGFGGGGSDFANKNPNSELPFGGGVGGGVKVTPIAFLVIRGESVRMMPVASAPSTTADRVVEMIPDALDRIVSVIDRKVPDSQAVSE